MRIHSDIITTEHIIGALNEEKARGRIAPHVSFKTRAEHGSRVRARAYEIQLEAAARDNGRRAGNSGSYGAMRPEHDGFAATYDEWGWFIAALYRVDAKMIVGSPKNPVYRDRHDFDDRTGMSYAPVLLIQAIESTGDPYPITTGQAARTKRGYVIGRQGANRQPEWYAYGKMHPRTVEDVREFAKIEAEGVNR